MKAFTFEAGVHDSPEHGLCVMEAVAMLAGEPHSDRPNCACPIVTELAISINDSSDDQQRQELLLDMPWRIVGTKTDDYAITKKRFGILLDLVTEGNWQAGDHHLIISDIIQHGFNGTFYVWQAGVLCMNLDYQIAKLENEGQASGDWYEVNKLLKKAAKALGDMIDLTEPKETVPQLEKANA